MRVLFLTKLVQDRVFHPYTLYVLSAVCRQAGHVTDVVDAKSLEHVREKILAFRPDVLAVSTISSRWSFFRQLTAELKREFGLPIIVGGAHPTVRPSVVLEPGIDAACIMEGEQPLVEFLSCLSSGTSFADIRNLAVKDPSQPAGFRVNPLRPLITDLDSLPFPHFELTDHYPPSRNMPVRIMMTSRGCLFACTSCGHSSFRPLYPQTPVYYRRPSVRRVMEELTFIKQRYPVHFFAFFDDVFAVNDGWELEFAEEYARQIAVPFSVHMVNGLVDPKSVAALKKAGLQWVGISLESGNQRVLTEVLDRRYAVEDFINSIRILNEAGIANYVGNILALPGSTLDLDLETLEVNRRAGVGFADSSIYIPMPGTKLGEYARANQMFDVERFDRSFHSTDPSLHEPVILDVPHRPVVRRLQCLFEIAAGNEWVYRNIRWLIRLPLFPLYLLLWKVHNALKKNNYLFGPARLTWRQKFMLAYYTLTY